MTAASSVYQSPVKLAKTMRKSISEKQVKPRFESTQTSATSQSRNNADKLPAINSKCEVLAQKMTHQSSNQKTHHQRASAKRPLESAQKHQMPGQSTEEPEPNHPRSSKSKAVMIDQRYEIRKKIDEGTYAKVYLS